MKRGFSWAAAGLVVLAFPSWALANAGTPLMWGSCFHLVFGNALIGLGEGWLLAWWFGLPRWRSMLIMIAANYISAWAGIWLLGPVGLMDILPRDLYNAWRWLWIMVAGMYVFTVLIEWPFVAWCLYGTAGRWWRRSLYASVLVQTASYGLLIGWYGMVSAVSLYTRMEVVPPAALSLPQAVAVYYLATDSGNVYVRSLAGGEARLVAPLHATGKFDRLYAQPNGDTPDHWDLMARVESGDLHNIQSHQVVVTPDLAGQAVPDVININNAPLEYGKERINIDTVFKLGEAVTSPWECRTGFWNWEGLVATNTTTHEVVQMAFDTPMGNWRIGNAVQLPGDKVLFQLGDHQICVFDLATRRIALLWHGRGPVAFIGKNGAAASTTQASTTQGSTTPPSATQAGTAP